jgi:CRP-like cAMP-binding protein
MYKDIFNESSQNEMRSFFLEEFSKRGMIKRYNKNDVIHIPGNDFVAIVVEGKIKQTLYSSRGTEKILFFLRTGEIFGEMDYFGGGKDNVIAKAVDNSVISVIKQDQINIALDNKPEAYKYFLHSITRKFRIVMLQMSDMYFNTSLEKIADALLRLSCQGGGLISKEGKGDGSESLVISMTHQELADLIGCSRITVTKGLNELKDKKIVGLQNRKVIINDIKKLEDILNTVE